MVETLRERKKKNDKNMEEYCFIKVTKDKVLNQEVFRRKLLLYKLKRNK